jgi:hypothetical protein
MVKARMRKKVAAANQAATEMDGEDDPGSKEEADAELDATMSSLAGHQKRKVTKRAKFLEKIRVATANKMKKSGKKKGGERRVLGLRHAGVHARGDREERHEPRAEGQARGSQGQG